MVELTVGVASAFIAAGIAISQFILPNALSLILTALLTPEQPAATWSVVSRFILSSDWPIFLRSEAATSASIPRKLSLVTWTKPLGLLLIAVAAIVTPLGLYEEIAPSLDPVNVQFSYAADISLFGTRTPARSDRGFRFSRVCGDYLCPGDPDAGNFTMTEIYNISTNETRLNSYFIKPESMPSSLIDLYESGPEKSSPSLSRYFDVQARQWTTRGLEDDGNNATLLEADYEYISSVFMKNKISLIEGLVVDTEHGGIGFRNHSIPVADSLYGTEWEEDILWMEPESACVDTNITVMYAGEVSDIQPRTAELVDRGGFCNLQKVNPYYTPSNETRDYIFSDAQKNPWLYERAYYLAWYSNALSMLYLNLTDPMTNRSRISSQMGQRFKVNGSITSVSSSSYSNDFFKLSRGNYMITMPWKYSWNSTLGKYNDYPGQNPMVPNPYNVTLDELLTIEEYCVGASAGDKVNISSLDVKVGFFAGPAVMLNRSDPSNSSSAATWERPYYACSGATKISVKTIRFRYNSTKVAALSNLEIMGIGDKEYSNDADKPTWGFETPWLNANTTWNLSMIDPLWSIVRENTPPNKNITTVRSERFYLPSSHQTITSLGWESNIVYRDYTPGTSGPSAAWYHVFHSSFAEDPFSANDLEKQRFISSLMVNSTGTAKLLRLMWTDLAANLLVGTRGLHTPPYELLQTSRLDRRSDTFDFTLPPTGQYPVYLRHRHIRYYWIYGIPALICICIIIAVLVTALGVVLGGQATVARLRWYMFNTSCGRILAAHAYPEMASVKLTETKEWLDRVGRESVVVSGHSTGVELQENQVSAKTPQTYVRLENAGE